jgi:hypothetical protein
MDTGALPPMQPRQGVRARFASTHDTALTLREIFIKFVFLPA